MNKTIRTILKVVAILFFIIPGVIWFLQGINLMPGSFMTGNPQWAVNGGIAVVFGAGLFWFANRK